MLQFDCQSSACKSLDELASYHRHNILIEGDSGLGKTTLAKYYANKLHIDDFVIVKSSVDSIRGIVENCIHLNTPVVVCIENLDSGVKSAAYALLKQLEEPNEYTYIVVTCSRAQKVPDTIVSRSSVVSIGHPTEMDLLIYLNNTNHPRTQKVKNSPLWKAAHSFADVDVLLNLDDKKTEYITKLNTDILSNEPVSNIVWRLGHFEDNTELPIRIALQYIIAVCGDRHIKNSAIQCMRTINDGNIAAHAALSMFMLDVKYCE